MDKDRAIITQVCAKIAADLTTREGELDTRLSEYAVIFSTIKDIVFDEIFTNAPEPEADATTRVTAAFPGSTVSDTAFAGVHIKGTAHGPIPEWLIKACKRDGVTEVWDNRDGLVVNPKRPSFRATNGEKSYWPPRGK